MAIIAMMILLLMFFNGFKRANINFFLESIICFNIKCAIMGESWIFYKRKAPLPWQVAALNL
jgi:hypothetical protein